MKIRIMCVVLSALLLLPLLGFNAYAAEYRNYTLDEWKELTREEIQELMTSICDDNGTTYQGTVNDVYGMDGYCLWKSYQGLAGYGDTYVYGLKYFDGRLNAEMMLEMYGLADFGRGLYNSLAHHDGGGFGGRRSANDDFEEFEKQYPYSGDSDHPAYKFSNGYYVTWEPMYNSDGSMAFEVQGVRHRKTWYKIRFYLHDETGRIVDMYIHPYSMSCICDKCQKEPFEDFTITQYGKFYYTYYGSASVHIATPSISQEYDIPWYSVYGQPEETEPPSPSIPVVLYDDDGNSLNATKDGDYITYEGSTYTYNTDNSVNIGDTTYYSYYDYTNMDEDYLNDFYKYLLDEIEKLIGSGYKFDDSSILSALKSIYDKIYNIITNIQLAADNIVSSVQGGFNNIASYLRDILDQLKLINKEMKEQTEEEEEKNILAWLDLIEDFKNKVGWASLETSVENIKTAFFGERTFSENSDGSVDVTITTEEHGAILSSLPDLYITVNDQKYSLYGCVSYLGAGIETIKLFISSFLWISFIIAVFRSVPSIIGGVASVQDHSNNVVIDKNTGEVKRGG